MKDRVPDQYSLWLKQTESPSTVCWSAFKMNMVTVLSASSQELLHSVKDGAGRPITNPLELFESGVGGLEIFSVVLGESSPICLSNADNVDHEDDIVCLNHIDSLFCKAIILVAVIELRCLEVSGGAQDDWLAASKLISGLYGDVQLAGLIASFDLV